MCSAGAVCSTAGVICSIVSCVTMVGWNASSWVVQVLYVGGGAGGNSVMAVPRRAGVA